MNEVICLATKQTYDLVNATMITAHPAVSPYPRNTPSYLIPIKGGGTMEILYSIVRILECYPDDIYTFRTTLTDAQFHNLVAYHETRKTSFGYGNDKDAYRFYILEEYGRIEQPFGRKGIQVSKKMDFTDIPIQK